MIDPLEKAVERSAVMASAAKIYEPQLTVLREENALLTARVAELEGALRPLACTCEAESQDECSRSEKHCPFWTARAAITKGERNE